MTRVVGWIVLTLTGLAFVTALLMSDADRAAIRGDVQEGLFEMSDGGEGYFDGEPVWQQEAPVRITLEQLPTLEGRLRGSRYNEGFMTGRMSWLGVSLRECIAHCFELPAARVLGDESLDGIWLDVDAGRTQGLFGSSLEGWEDAHASILDGVLSTYGLAVHAERRPVDVTVLRAGERWADHVAVPDSSQTVTSGFGVLELERAHVEHLLGIVRTLHPYDVLEGVDELSRCTLAIRWDPEAEGDLERVLADELDLHFVQETRELDVVLVEGVATSPLEPEHEPEPVAGG